MIAFTEMVIGMAVYPSRHCEPRYLRRGNPTTVVDYHSSILAGLLR